MIRSQTSSTAVGVLAAVVSGVSQSALAAGPGAMWVWNRPDVEQDAPKETVYFRRSVRLAGQPRRAEIHATADNKLRFFLNGREMFRNEAWETPVKADLAPFLQAGDNVLAVRADNDGSAAGLFVAGRAELADGTQVDLSTGDAWRWSNKAPIGWDRPGFDDSTFKPVAVLGDAGVAPWTIGDKLASAVAASLPRDPSFWVEWRTRRDAELATLPHPDPPPQDTAADNPVDAFLYAAWKKDGIETPGRCRDARFVRRAYLDLVGLLPPVEVLERFERDASSEKRARLIDTLLADDGAYAEHWMSFWNDHLRNDEQTAIDGLRKPITTWLFDALRDDMPYDVFVANLLNPDTYGPEGYIKGVNWRGTVSASQRPVLQAAQNVSQVFLAAPIKCASCHDSFIDDWTLRDAYGLAAFFSDENLTTYECDKSTGEVVAPRFMFPEIGGIEPTSGLAERRQRIAELVTSPRNTRFAKVIVNRLWHRLIGRPLFEPLDTYEEGEARHPALLAWLADDFQRNRYDLKHLIRRIAVSHAYQLPSVAVPEQASKSKQVPGPPLRRLSAEQICDGIATLTGHWPKADVMNVAVSNPNIRAWRQKVPDALLRALGRPAREQANTKREDDATVLQMLEMVNGTVLTDRLRHGVDALLRSSLADETDAAKVVDFLYRRAMSRHATAEEIALLAPLLGKPGESSEARRPGWEDALWSIVMDPEFQFVY